MTGLGLAVIGPGAIADAHLEAFATLGGVEPIWAVGRTVERTQEFADRWGIQKSGTRIDEVLDDPRVSVALICSPNGLHAQQADAFLAAGRDVILEIPIAMSSKEAEALVHQARAQGRRLFACHTMRSFAGIRYLRELLASGREAVTQIQGFFAIPRRNNQGFKGTRTWVDDLLWHHGCHLVDASLWVTGSTQIATGTLLRGSEHPEYGMTMDLAMSFAMEGRCIVSHSLTYNASALSWQMRFCGNGGDYLFDTGKLIGTAGEVLVDGGSIRDLGFQNAQILQGLRTGTPTDFDADGVLPAMHALASLQEGVHST